MGLDEWMELDAGRGMLALWMAQLRCQHLAGTPGLPGSDCCWYINGGQLEY
jgi:hypothetical protein